MTEAQLINGCRQGKRKAQKSLYDMFARKMMALCLRYCGDRALAEDMLQEGFIRVFAHIGEYGGDGAFEGWIRRIFVNCALTGLRQQRAMPEQESLESVTETVDDGSLASITTAELLELVRELPPGFRTVFNMYAIEGYSHAEIAEMLKITEGASRSQYARARLALQSKVKRLYDNEYGKF